jgi:glucose uptake protein GlcU
MYDRKTAEIVLGLLILVFALWETTYSRWIIIVTAVLLLVQGIMLPTSNRTVKNPKKKTVKKKKK